MTAAKDNEARMRRLIGVLTVLTVTTYAGVAYVTAAAAGKPFTEVQAFPIGGGAGDGGWLFGSVSLILGVLLGWAIPGCALALMFPPPQNGSALVARAFGLGVGYLLLTGLAHGAFTGHAPERATLLLYLALPGSLLLVRPARAPRPGVFSGERAIVIAFGAVTLLTAVLWPKLRYEGMNGDGTELYELTRSLERHTLPRWELEDAAPPGRFGTPITVPYLTTAHTAFAGMTILGKGELAIRVPFVLSVAVALLATMSLSQGRQGTAWMYAGAVCAVFVLWNAYYVGWEPPRDLAEPAGTDAITSALLMAGLLEIFRGSTPLGAAFLALSWGATWSAPVLTLFVVALLVLLDRDRGWHVFRWVTAAAVLFALGLACIAWSQDLWSDWLRAFLGEYWDDLAYQDRRVPSSPLLGWLLLLTGFLPVVAIARWRRISVDSRILLLTAVAYTAVVMIASHKSLHYLMPLPWILMTPALEASGPRQRLAAASLLGITFLLSWPGHPEIQQETIQLGKESCVTGFDYESAALSSSPVHQAIAQPPARSGHFAVGRHTFVRYAMAIGGSDCVVGLSPSVPPGALTVIEGSTSVVWTSDIDRFVEWRFRGFRDASPVIGGRDGGTDGSRSLELGGRISLAADEAHRLFLAGVSDRSSNGVVVQEMTRLLVPVRERGTIEVRLGHRVASDREVMVRVNGSPPEPLLLRAGTGESAVRGPWRTGWNMLDIDRAADLTLLWIDSQSRER